MARIRTIKPEFWEDELIGALSRDTRLLFIASWNAADDEGLTRWSPAFLKSVAFRYDWEITEAAVRDMMTELERSNLVFPYVGGKASEPLAWIINFRKHQKINRAQPGRLPCPSLQNPTILAAYLRRDGYVCHLCGGPVPTQRVHGNSTNASLNASLDHLVPRAHGGHDYPSNLRVAHLGCNKARGSRPIETFRPPFSVKSVLVQHFRGSELQAPDPNDLRDPLQATENVQVRSRARSVNDSVNDDSVTGSLSHSLGEGNREQGREEEKTPSGRAPRRAEPIDARTITAAWVDQNRANGVNPSTAQIGQVARLAKDLLARNEPELVLKAARTSGRKGFTNIDRELTALAARSTREVEEHYGHLRFDPKTGLGIER